TIVVSRDRGCPILTGGARRRGRVDAGQRCAVDVGNDEIIDPGRVVAARDGLILLVNPDEPMRTGRECDGWYGAPGEITGGGETPLDVHPEVKKVVFQLGGDTREKGDVSLRHGRHDQRKPGALPVPDDARTRRAQTVARLEGIGEPGFIAARRKLGRET